MVEEAKRYRQHPDTQLSIDDQFKLRLERED